MLMLDLPNTTEVLSPIGRALPSGTTRHVIADGIKGTAQTIKMMQDLVNAGKRDNDIRALVGSILNPADGKRPVDSKDYYNYGRVLYEWVRDNILYAYDPHMVEYLEKPSIILKNRIGDCDSMDILLCSMFEQVGLQSQFVTIKADASRPDEYTHVYTRVMIPKLGWVVADPIMPGKWFGWEPPFPNGRRYWAATTDALDQSLDTSESVPFPNPGQPMRMDSFSDVVGMSGLGRTRQSLQSRRKPVKRLADWEGGMTGLGRGGRHGGHSHGRSWGGGDGFVAYGDNSLVPVGIPVPDQIIVVREVEVQPQQTESVFADDENIGVQGFGGFDGVISDSFDAAQRALGIAPRDVSQDYAKSFISKLTDGTEAKRLNDARATVNAQVDTATKLLNTAKALPDSNSQKSSAIAAATNLRNAAYASNYAINDAMGKYNEIAALVNNLPFASGTIPSLRGLGWVVPAAFVVGVGILWLIHEYGIIWQTIATAQQTAAEADSQAKQFAFLKDPSVSDANKLAYLSKTPAGAAGQCGPSNIGQCWRDFQTGVGVSILNTGLAVGGAFILYKIFDAWVFEGGRNITRAAADRITRRINE